jgi:2-keto-3-deoxy-L-rhamnonate aldolase RhmA
VTVTQAAVEHMAIVAADGHENWSELDLRELQPALQRPHRAGRGARVAGDLDLPPTGLASQPDERAGVEDLDPAAAVDGIVAIADQPDDLGASQRPGKAHQQHCAVSQPAQVVAQRGEHRPKLVGSDCLLLHRWPSMAAADAGENGCDVAVATVEPEAALRVAPGKTR